MGRSKKQHKGILVHWRAVRELWKRIFSTSRNDFEIISYAYRSRHSFRRIFPILRTGVLQQNQLYTSLGESKQGTLIEMHPKHTSSIEEDHRRQRREIGCPLLNVPFLCPSPLLRPLLMYLVSSVECLSIKANIYFVLLRRNTPPCNSDTGLQTPDFSV